MKLQFRKALHEEKRPISGYTKTTEKGDIVNVQPYQATKKIGDPEATQPRQGAQQGDQPSIRIGKKDDQAEAKPQAQEEQKQADPKKEEQPEPKKAETEGKAEKQPTKGKRFNKVSGKEWSFRDGEFLGAYDEIYQIPIDMIMKKPEGQIREKEDLGWVKKLAEGMKESGQLTPVSVVIRGPDNKDENPTGKDMFTLLSGNHRFFALSRLVKEGAIDPTTGEKFESLKVIVKETSEYDNATLEIMENMFQLKMKPFDYAKSVARLYNLKLKSGMSHADALTEVAAMCKTEDGANMTEDRAYKSISMMNLVPEIRSLVNAGEKEGMPFEHGYRISRHPQEDQLALMRIMSGISGRGKFEKFNTLMEAYFKEKEYGAVDMFGAAARTPDQIQADLEKERAEKEKEQKVGKFHGFFNQFKSFFKVDPGFGSKEMAARGTAGKAYKQVQQEIVDSLPADQLQSALEQARVMQYHANALVDYIGKRITIDEETGGGTAIKDAIASATQNMDDTEKEQFFQKKQPTGLFHMDGIEEELEAMERKGEREPEPEAVGKAMVGGGAPDLDSIIQDDPDSADDVWKNPLRYTKEEFIRACVRADSTFNPIVEKDDALKYHAYCVSLAKSKGKKIPDRVLVDYPEVENPMQDDPDWREEDWFYDVTGQPRPGEDQEAVQSDSGDNSTGSEMVAEPAKKAFVRWRQRWIH